MALTLPPKPLPTITKSNASSAPEGELEVATFASLWRPNCACKCAIQKDFEPDVDFFVGSPARRSSDSVKELIAMKKITTRVGLGISVFALGACLTSIALADAPKTDDQARPQCSGEHGGKRSEADRKQHAAERFKKADKN